MGWLSDQVARLAGHQVAVVGDVMLDEYLYGRPERLSREAAIPVLEFQRRQVIPGGAANPAVNITALGSVAHSVALVGADPSAAELRTALEAAGVLTAGLQVDTERGTTTKTRILAAVPLTVAQQVARLDRIDRSPPSAAVEEAALAYLSAQMPHLNAVVCSDYRIGFLSDALVGALRDLAAAAAVPLVVDSQGHFEPYAGATFLKCNLAEASTWLARPLTTDAEVAAGLQQIKEHLNLGSVAITRGGAGYSLLDADGLHHVPAIPIGEVFDATGAGDTFVAVTALGICAGLPVLAATKIANAAAALVVRRIGVASVPPAELQAMLEPFDV